MNKNEELSVESKKFFNFYKKKLGESIRSSENVVLVSFSDLSGFSPLLSEALMESPEEILSVMELALEESGLVKNPKIRFTNLPENNFIKIKNLRAKHLGKFLWIEGIVRQASDVRPQVVSAKFECPSCGTIISVLQLEKKFKEPSRCSCGRKGFFKLISKHMVDAQRLVLEEAPDNLSGGEQPRRLNVFLKEDLVEPRMEERTTPGSKVRVFGVLNEIPITLQTGSISTRFDLALDSNNIIPLEESYDNLQISEEEELQIKELALDPNIFQRLYENIAPSIYGYEEVKQSILLQLFGGVKKRRADGTFTRGDVHVLLVGDPGVAKSITLGFISKLAPRGRYVVGKSTSGAGLCVSPDSLVLTNPGGMESIKCVVENRLKIKKEFKPGVWKQDKIKDVKIQSLSNDLKLQSKFPDSIWRLNSPQKLYEVILSSGKKIKLTANTQLLSIYEDGLLWKKSKELKIGDYIATPRKLVGGNIKNQYCLDLISSNPVIPNIKPFVNELVEQLKEKYGSIRKAAKKLKIPEDRLYHGWVNEDAGGNIKLIYLKKIASDLGIEYKDFVKEVSLYNGKIHTIPKFLSGDLVYVAGLIAGDGDIRKTKTNTLSIRLSNNNKKLHSIFRNVFEREFGLKGDIQKSSEKRPESSRFNSKIAGEILLSLGIPLSPKSNKLFISNNLLHLSNELFCEFLAGLYDADGSICLRKTRGSGCIDFTTCSEKLARQLQLALLRFEIHSVLRKREPSKGLIKGNYPRWVLEIREFEQIKKFNHFIKLRHPDKKRKLELILKKNKCLNTNIDVIPNIAGLLKEELLNQNFSLRKVGWHENISRDYAMKIVGFLEDNERVNNLKKIIMSDIFWERIKSLKEVNSESEYVYDLTVNDSHNFVVDGVLVHNTATVVKDEILKGWSLEAGAMVLSNKGIVCIDEIEKMDPQDRSSMHEAMEQQSVTISKANVQASLRAETSVLAAGNPKYGRFDPNIPIAQQVDIQPTLLNRFDVIFMLRDMPDKSKDEAIASHVLEEHMNPAAKGSIDLELFRKYIAYSKQKIVPNLSPEAVNEIKSFYIGLRNSAVSYDGAVRPLPITARQLNSLVRMSEASARTRLSEVVEKKDAVRAINIMKYYLMQAGFDEESNSVDIDKIVSGVTASKRSKIVEVKNKLYDLKAIHGKKIPKEIIKKEFEGKLNEGEMDDILDKLAMEGDIFYPSKDMIGFT